MIATPLVFVRKIEKFSFTYILADFLILATAVSIIGFSSKYVADNGWGEGVVAFNKSTWLTMIGSAVFSFEGIGVVIPILEVTEKPEVFPKLLFFVVCTVMVLYTGFGTFNYFVYGDLLVDPLITSNLTSETSQAGNILVYVIKIVFSFNIIFTYTLMIFPVNTILESYFFHKMPKSKKRQWLKNLSRTIIVMLTVVICILLKDKLDKFLSLIGTLASTPVSITIPCLFHYILCKPTQTEKIVNIGIIILSVLILVFCSGFTLWTWNDS